MQRLGLGGAMRNYSPSPANSTGGLFTTKSGAIDRQKLALVLVCSALALWVVYDAYDRHTRSRALRLALAKRDKANGRGATQHCSRAAPVAHLGVCVAALFRPPLQLLPSAPGII